MNETKKMVVTYRHDSVMTRLDQLQELKHLAQIEDMVMGPAPAKLQALDMSPWDGGAMAKIANLKHTSGICWWYLEFKMIPRWSSTSLWYCWIHFTRDVFWMHFTWNSYHLISHLQIAKCLMHHSKLKQTVKEDLSESDIVALECCGCHYVYWVQLPVVPSIQRQRPNFVHDSRDSHDIEALSVILWWFFRWQLSLFCLCSIWCAGWSQRLRWAHGHLDRSGCFQATFQRWLSMLVSPSASAVIPRDPLPES